MNDRGNVVTEEKVKDMPSQCDRGAATKFEGKLPHEGPLRPNGTS